MLAAAAERTFIEESSIRLLNKINVYGIAKDSDIGHAYFLEMEIDFNTTIIHQSAKAVPIDVAFNYGLNKLMDSN